MNKKWEVNKREEEKIEQVAQENNISPLLASILVNIFKSNKKRFS